LLVVPFEGTCHWLCHMCVVLVVPCGGWLCLAAVIKLAE
jgi:hypothetical protein